MPDPADSNEFAGFAVELHSEPDTEHTLQRVVEYAQEATGCDDVGVLLRRERGRLESALTTSPRVNESDRLQSELGEGPCIEAIWNDDSFLVPDTTTDERWPKWGKRVAELGIRSAIGLRLSTLRRTIGALNLYANEPEYFTDDDLEVADLFAQHAALALAAANEEDGLKRAIGTRQLIGQAQGILMERYSLDADRAFALMRRHSQQHNIKLNRVAEQIIETRRLPGKE
ncbi:GAF and ANTAR domain-containing protein [Phytoactinopolyspora halotolerans]|uniref:GAF and ANTAR domain-containing protein n=1 Tax=Phytoactinopolyspora halotolerans TaxID=1981512 RepID=A0A6L9S9L8_9ACTN|nr:GAF and ANTAR domain-containing protein [Phytoactinopolyspora halotolerans]NEE01926.1 GAF and ANTAR domain-containing protein [Phytoactinopolyspora halotolerans]